MSTVTIYKMDSTDNTKPSLCRCETDPNKACV